jgi:hypothetical protein
MPISRVRDRSPAGRVVARSFRKLSKIRRNLPLTARPKIGKKTGLQKPHRRSEDPAFVPSKKRSAKAKGLPKKPMKLCRANPGPSAKLRHLPARGATGTPGSIRPPSRARAPRTDFRGSPLNRPQPQVRKNSGPDGIQKPAELPEVIAKNLKIIDQVALAAQQFSQTLPEKVSQVTSSQPAPPEPPLSDEPAPEVVDPPTEPREVEESMERLPQPEEPAQFVAPPVSQAVATLLATAHPAPVRITAAKLELEIAQATKMADPSCAEFVGVVVQRIKTKSSSDANWSLRGIRFGRSDRRAADGVLKTIVERMQREFRLSDN